MEEVTPEIPDQAAVLQQRLRDFQALCDKVLQQAMERGSLAAKDAPGATRPAWLTGAPQSEWRF